MFKLIKKRKDDSLMDGFELTNLGALIFLIVIAFIMWVFVGWMVPEGGIKSIVFFVLITILLCSGLIRQFFYFKLNFINNPKIRRYATWFIILGIYCLLYFLAEPLLY